jgi:hypothetical protein
MALLTFAAPKYV